MSTEHFLVDSWNTILTALEEKDMAANLMSVDFSKAFNRINHFCCLTSLSDMGAEETTIDWVASFLYNRTMRVKIGAAMSAARSAPGGSPQGSILGNFLFCATTDKFASLNGDPAYISDVSSSSGDSDPEAQVQALDPPLYSASTPTTRGQFIQFAPPNSLANLSGEYESDDDDFEFFRIKKRFDFDTSSSDDPSIYENIDAESARYHSMQTYVYIDDFNAIESIDLRNALSHTCGNERERPLRGKSKKISVRCVPLDSPRCVSLSYIKILF